MKNKRKILYVASAIILIAGLLSGCALLGLNNYTMRAYNGRVVDLETGKPLADAVVSAVYYHGHNTLAGSNHYQTDIQEMVTDENGYFAIPDTVVESNHTRGNLPGKLHIFKPGYGTLKHKRSKWTCRNSPDKQKCPVPYYEYVVFELPRLTEREERLRNLPGMFSGIPYKKQRILIKAINRESKDLKAPTITYPKEDHLSPTQALKNMSK